MLIPSIDLQGGHVVQLVQGERLAIEARDASGQLVGRSEAMGVVLPSSSRAWTLGGRGGAPSELLVRTAAGETRVAVRVAP